MMDQDEVARKIFASIDLNRDGVLSADELRAWLECKGEETLSNALLAQLDTDGDGAVSLQEFIDGFRDMRGNLAKVVHVDSPVYRAVSLAWLAQFVKAHAGTTQSWDVVKEFMAEEDGGGKDTSLIVTSDNIETHRDKRRAAEKTKSGKPVPVEYRDIPFEQMYTTDIVECFVRSLARKEHMSYAQAKNLPVGAPTYFISHAWGSTFVDLVKSVTGALAGAAQADTYVWLDIFAINQDDTGGVFSAMAELDDGKTLASTVETSRATLVVLDKERVIPLTRLWCLYEIGSTPPQKLQLVTHGFSENDVSHHIRNIDAETALCFSPADKEMIHGEITGKFRFASMRHFTEELKLRFMLRPMSYESDLQALRERGLSNNYQLEELREHVTSTGGRLACVVGGPGEGKSSVAAAALDMVHASHFCKRADVRRQDVLEMVRSLGFQLGQRFDVVRECLIDLEEDTAAKALVDPDVAMNALLVDPLKKLGKIQKQDHTGFFTSASYSADGTRIVSAGGDKAVRVWNATTGARISVLEGHSHRVPSASYSADGTRIVSASSDSTVRVWNATTGACVSVLEGHSDVSSASYSADGTRIVSASSDSTVRVWDATTSACVSVLKGHTGQVNSASYSADGTRIVSASYDSTVRVWDATTGACISVLKGHSDVVRSASLRGFFCNAAKCRPEREMLFCSSFASYGTVRCASRSRLPFDTQGFFCIRCCAPSSRRAARGRLLSVTNEYDPTPSIPAKSCWSGSPTMCPTGIPNLLFRTPPSAAAADIYFSPAHRVMFAPSSCSCMCKILCE